MKAIILAGGLGTRLKPFTEVIPKPLLPVGEKAVLEIQMEHLEEHGFNEIFLATNFKSRYIENFFGDGSQYGVTLTISNAESRIRGLLVMSRPPSLNATAMSPARLPERQAADILRSVIVCQRPTP